MGEWAWGRDSLPTDKEFVAYLNKQKKGTGICRLKNSPAKISSSPLIRPSPQLTVLLTMQLFFQRLWQKTSQVVSWLFCFHLSLHHNYPVLLPSTCSPTLVFVKALPQFPNCPMGLVRPSSPRLSFYWVSH